MKKAVIILLGLLSANQIYSQDLGSFFNSNESKVTYLGIDFSHVKIIGDFSQFFGAGEKDVNQIRDIYFPAWNNIILDHRDKYNLNKMLRKNDIYFDIDEMMKINSLTPEKELESYNAIHYSNDEIKTFITKYDIKGKNGYGICFIAEQLNKPQKEAYFYFVILSMPKSEVLLCERIRGEPSGFGLKSYWAGAINDIIKQIKNKYYNSWKSKL